jgi:hypothetical protein
MTPLPGGIQLPNDQGTFMATGTIEGFGWHNVFAAAHADIQACHHPWTRKIHHDHPNGFEKTSGKR